MSSYSDAFTDSSLVLLESHATNTWVKQTGFTGSAAISNANRLRQNTTSGLTRYYVTNHAPATAYFDLSVAMHVFSLAGSSGLLLRASGSDQSGYLVYWRSDNKIGLFKSSSSGVLTQLGSLATVTWAIGDDHTLKVSVRDGGSGNPRFTVFVDGAGTAAIDYTDTTSPFADTQKHGIYFQGNASPGDATGVHLDNFAAADPSSLSANVTTLPPNTGSAPVLLTGVGTSWTPGTPGSPSFTIATVPNPGTPPTIAAQTVNSTTTATLTINTGNAAPGAVITITDPGTSNSVSFTVAAALTAGTVTVGTVTATSVALSATPATGGTLPYRYQWHRSTTSGFTPGSGTALTGATSLSLNDTAGLAYPNTYYYVLVVTDATGASANSAQTAGVSPPSPAALVAGAITIGALGPNSVALTSTSPTGGVGPYTQQLYRSQVQSFTPGPGTAIAGATSLSYTDTGVAPNQTYYYIMVYTDSQGTVVASTVWTTPPVSATTPAAGAATALTVLPPGSGPQSYVGDVSALWTVALFPLGATVASPLVVTLVESGGTGTFLLSDGVTPITTVSLTTGQPSAQFRLSDPVAGVKAVSVTNTASLTPPPAVTYTVMTLLQQVIGVTIDPGAGFTGQAANIVYSVEDGVGTVIIPPTTGQVWEGQGGNGNYYMWPVVSYDIAGSVIVKGLTGTNAPSYAQQFFPSKPGATLLGSRDTAAIQAKLVAAGTVGTDGGVLVSGDTHSSGLTVASLANTAGMKLAADGLSALRALPNVTTTTLAALQAAGAEIQLAAILHILANLRTETPSGILIHFNNQGQAFLTSDVSKPDGITTTVTPR